MTRLLRWAFNIAAITSAVLFVAMCTMWVRSYFKSDVLLRARTGGSHTWTAGSVQTGTGLMLIHRIHYAKYDTLKSTVQWQLHAESLNPDSPVSYTHLSREIIDATSDRHPFSIEEAFFKVVWDALVAGDLVMMDDLHLLSDVVAGGCQFYPRNGFLSLPLTVLTRYAHDQKKNMVFSASGHVTRPLSDWCTYIPISDFQSIDYDDLCATFLGAEAAAGLDFRKIHRFAPNLSAHQLRAACLWFKGRNPDTESFIDYLRTRQMSTNVDLGEVQAVDLHDLKGIDDVLEALEMNLIMPLENDALAQELGIRPKRGVLLAGPPGTGKTTIGRALAHRLKSKFFLVDGTRCV